MIWFVFWIIVYLLPIIILTIWHMRAHDLERYPVNNRSSPTLPPVFTTLATFVGGASLLA